MKMLTLKNKYTKAAFLLITVLWMLFIFVLSAQTAKQSASVSDVMLENGAGIETDDETDRQYQKASTILRKGAHIFEFTLLGIFMFLFALHLYGDIRVRALGSVIACGAYGVTDELHQAFVDGRACMWQDMLIDLFAGALGTGAVFLAAYAVFKFKRRKI